MPLSEFYRFAKGKNKSAQQQHQEHDRSAAAGSGPSSSLHGADFVELVSENGQVTMKEQPDRVSKPKNGVLIDADLPHHNSIFRDKGAANFNEDSSEMGRRGKMDSVMNDFDHISEHEDIIPWFSYNMDANEPVQQHNQSSDFFREVSGVNAAESSIRRTGLAPSSDRVLPFTGSLHSSDQRHSSLGQRDLSSVRPNTSQLDRVSSFLSFRPKVSYSATHLISPVVHPSVKMQAQDLGQRVPSSSVINFPHFAAIVKPSLDAMSAKPNPEVVPTTKKDNGKEMVCGGELASPSQVQAILSKSLEMSHYVRHSGNVGCLDVSPRQEIVTSKTVASEHVVASSMCSANSVDRASNDPAFASKRKFNESEDSEYPSEDVEEESADIKKAVNNRLASGSKRSRTAEVHNLSERRRRDRINEKMRALQELIPNCNKVDKASMLDEAIEYLKTLQLQVQMMSMGPGACMPPMMLPHAAHMPRFSPMGIGMGYGLSMLDMNMNSSIPRFPMVSVSQFGALNANPMPNVPMFGFQEQGIGMPMSHAPIRTSMELNTASSAHVSHSKNIVHNVVTQMHVANQVENDEPDRSATAMALLKDDHPSTSKAREPSAKS